MSRRRALTTLMAIALLIGPWALAAEERRGEPGSRRQRDAVHFKQALKANDPDLTEALEGGVTSLRDGHELVVLFDGQSVTSLRRNSWKQGKTPLEDGEFSGKERRELAARLGVEAAEAPRNYLEYVQYLAKRGAKVFVNRSAVRLYGLGDDEIHPLARPISTRQMSDLLDEAELCYTYGK